MAASTQIIADLKTVISNGPSSTTTANSIAAAGPINDYVGNCNQALLKAEELDVMVGKLASLTAASDDNTNKGLLNGVVAVLAGTASPSTQIVTDLGTVISNGPSATTTANSIAAAGPITDYKGMTNVAQILAEGLKTLVTMLKNVTDNATDGTNRTLLTNIITALS